MSRNNKMNAGDVGLMLSMAFALRPMAEMAEEFDRHNTCRPEHPAKEILYQLGDKTITLQHCFNAQRLLKELMS